MRTAMIAAACLTLLGQASSSAQPSPSLVLNRNIVIVERPDAPGPVKLAVEDLRNDFEKVLGAKPGVVTQANRIGTPRTWQRYPAAWSPEGSRRHWPALRAAANAGEAATRPETPRGAGQLSSPAIREPFQHRRGGSVGFAGADDRVAVGLEVGVALGVTGVDVVGLVVAPDDSALTGTNLRLILHNLGIRNVVCAGIFTDQCVSSTVRSLADESYNVVVVEDCCAAGSDELHRKELEIINMIYCHVMSSAELIRMMRL